MDSIHNISQQRSLALDIERDRLSYLVFGDESKPEMATIALDGDLKQALENAVYDTPQLLEEYSRITIALHSQHFVVMPSELAEQKMAKRVFDASFSQLEGELMVCKVKNTDAAIACDVSQGVKAFLNRTFGNPELLHHLAPLCAYCAEAYADDNGCLHINIINNEAHIVATLGGKLQLANTYSYRSLDDVVYFALAAFKECRFDSRADKILLTGDNELRSQLAEQLRQRIAYVMPEIFPAQAMALGKEAITYPFNLIAIALY